MQKKDYWLAYKLVALAGRVLFLQVAEILQKEICAQWNAIYQLHSTEHEDHSCEQNNEYY